VFFAPVGARNERLEQLRSNALAPRPWMNVHSAFYREFVAGPGAEVCEGGVPAIRLASSATSTG
jgi:hypothetical protein